MPTVALDDVSINYRQAGHGEDVVLIHGLAANHAFWNLELLLPLARRYRVTTFDLRGHGYSSMPPVGYTSDRIAGDLIGLMDHLGIERAHLVGHSFGGVVACQCAVRSPQRVRSVTMADTRLRALQPNQRLMDWPNWRQAKAQLEAHGIFLDERENDVGMLLLEKLADPEAASMRQGWSKGSLFVPFSGWSNGNRSAARWLKLLETTSARHDFRDPGGLTEERLAAVRQPVLGIYGERSRCMKTCRRLPSVLSGCQIVMVPATGHFFPVIRPAFVAETLMRFFGAVVDEDECAA